jgi:hypothetical protein
MNDPRKVFKELSALYQFHRKLAKAYSLPSRNPPRVAEPPPPPPPPSRPAKPRDKEVRA